MADSQPLQTQAHVDFIVHLIVRSERAEEVQAAQRQFEQAARLSPGYIRSRVEELADPPPGCRAFAAVHRFATPRELIGWLESDQRKKTDRPLSCPIWGGYDDRLSSAPGRVFRLVCAS